MKILSPAGNFDSLKTAVYNGADEVYLGINQFNARNNIDGFTMANLKEAVDFAHLHNVKVLLAINILFSDGELQSALDTVVDAYNLGVDAFIVQDLGLISLIYKNYPEIEIHASTQMGIHNLEGVKELVKYGVKRVVLARETPLDEVRRIKDNIDIEIEYFCHGALCVSFSGNCYLSSYMFGASGNRGRCKQLCRLPYTFLDGEKQLKKGYLLSAKDFNMINRLNDLKDAGVDVIKIEGRARRPYYVGCVTKAYKDALNGKKVDEKELELAFNRTFTEGYLNGNGKIISQLQNHVGVLVGRVEEVNNGKTFNEIFISSNIKLSPKSTLKMFNGDQENNTITAYDLSIAKKGLYRITTTQKVNVGDTVRLIVDAEKEAQNLCVTKKRQLKIKIELIENQKAKATLFICDKEYIVEGEECLPAIKQPITQEEIKSNFSKSQYFDLEIYECELRNAFMPKQKLNEFRRNVLDKAYQILTENNRKRLEKIKIKSLTNKGEFSFKNSYIHSPDTYELDKILKAMEECKNSGKEFYLDTPNFALKKDVEMLKEIIDKTGVKIIANNYYALSFNTEKVIGYGLNVYNSYTARELSAPYIIAENGENFNAPYMTLRHCPLKANINASCEKCPYHDGYKYKMESGKELKLKRKKLSSCTFWLV